MKVVNILQIKIYKLTEKEKVHIIRNWLGRGGLQLIQTFSNSGKEACKMVEGLFPTLVEKSSNTTMKPYYPYNIKYLKEKGTSLARSG